MKIKNMFITLASFLILGVFGCEDMVDSVVDNSIETPTSFVFESRFNAGESSVSYSGQVARNLLINDVKSEFKGGNGEKVLSLMANDDATATIATSAGTTTQTLYHDISTSHLNDRLTAVADYIIPGWEVNAGTL
jgi:hypothetical protein